ncbi:MAG TPA: alpha/beta fold hydrolase [Anaerolineales bacterium]|nr:alpha/beta fold hydrolase [Anaerolineales bacterium]
MALLQACTPGQSAPPTAQEQQLPPPAVTISRAAPTVIPAASQEAGVGGIAAEPTPTSPPNPYAAFTVDALAARSYGGGSITIHERMGVYDSFTRYLISYPSDGLKIYGFLNVPHGDGPFPVVIALHGYIDPAVYETLDYTTRYADALARSGFLVIHPNLRGYPPSGNADNLFRVGMASDVLNLTAIVRETGGDPGPLESALSERLGLWGHSMGGGISLRVLTVDPEIDAAVLYGSMSGDEGQNFQKISEWSEGTRGLAELEVPSEYYSEISPINYLDRIEASVSVHHGAADELVPPAWSDDLCVRLLDLRVEVTCYTYPDQPHTFGGEGDQLFVERMVGFLTQVLSP